MEGVLYFLRDTISGPIYFIYALIGYICMFGIIGYLYKQKFTKFAFNVKNTVSDEKKSIVQGKANIKKVAPVIVEGNGNNNVTQVASIPEVISNKEVAIAPINQQVSIPNLQVKETIPNVQSQTASSVQQTSIPEMADKNSI